MISAGEDELICDLAETYHILDYRALPVKTLGVLSCGLSPDSRIMRKLHGNKNTSIELIAAAIIDRLSLLVYANSKDARKGKNKPKMLLDEMTSAEKPQTESISFASGEDFKTAWNNLIKG